MVRYHTRRKPHAVKNSTQVFIMHCDVIVVHFSFSFFMFLFLFRRALCRSPFLFLTSGRIIALCFSFSFPTICFCLHQCLQLFYVSVVTVYISIMFLFLFYFYLCFSGRFLVVPPRMGRIFGLKFLFLYTSIHQSLPQWAGKPMWPNSTFQHHT